MTNGLKAYKGAELEEKQILAKMVPPSRIGYVYLIKGPKDYIGQSLDPDRRWITHKSFARTSPDCRGPLTEAIREHGEDEFTMYVLWKGRSKK